MLMPAVLLDRQGKAFMVLSLTAEADYLQCNQRWFEAYEVKGLKYRIFLEKECKKPHPRFILKIAEVAYKKWQKAKFENIKKELENAD